MRVYLRIRACTCTIAHCAADVCAYMLRRAVVQADHGGEGHKLNDVNALSTLCRCERRRHTGRPPSRVHRPPDCWLLPPATPRATNPRSSLSPLPSSWTSPRTDYNYRDLHSAPVSFARDESERTAARKRVYYLLHYLRKMYDARDARSLSRFARFNIKRIITRG